MAHPEKEDDARAHDDYAAEDAAYDSGSVVGAAAPAASVAAFIVVAVVAACAAVSALALPADAATGHDVLGIRCGGRVGDGGLSVAGGGVSGL